MNHFFGRNLKILRTEKMLNQTELGKQLNKGQKTIGNWETGYSEPCINDLLRISEIFEINIDDLLKREVIAGKVKDKEARNKYRDIELPAKKLPIDIIDAKRVLQENIPNGNTTGDGEIFWRDKYIVIIETHLSNLITHSVSEETIQDLMNRIRNLQKMVADLFQPPFRQVSPPAGIIAEKE